MMGKRGLSVVLYSFLLIFYFGIVLYAFIEVKHADTFANFSSAMFFEVIGFLLLAYFVIGGFLYSPIKTAFYPVLLIMTVLYTVVIHFISFSLISVASRTYFNLINLIILFVYLMISIPIYIIGRK